MRKRTHVMRVTPKFKVKGNEIMEFRVKRGLSKPKEFSEGEFTRLAMRCPSWNEVERELKTRPTKRK